MKGEGEKATALKKGPWTAEEDAVLVEYVNGHGEGNWNSVQKRTGLARCGKSCRLRWANHLRPNLKKGHFTPEEEAAILRLHAQMGNKWARMATQLPGRTDNEIKNYWNTRTKRLQRAGLPLYPPEIVHHHHQQQQRRVAVRGRGIVHRNAAGAAAAGGPMVMPFFFVGDSAGCMAPPRPRAVPVDYGQMPKLPVTTTGLPSSQLFFGETSGGGGGGGLLDMLLLQQVADGNGSREQMQDELQLLDQPAAMVKLGDSDSSIGETANGSSTTAAAINGEATEDQMKLLVDTIPTPTMPALPEWCGCNSGEICNGTQSVETNDELRLEMETSVAAEPIEQDWSIGSFPWNNMPGIC